MKSDVLREELKTIIRDVPDFPKEGILFRDITTLLKEREPFARVVDFFKNRYQNKGIQKIVCVEARGFIFGSAVAYAIGAGFIPIRKKGKLPYKTYEQPYELEYGQGTLEIHQDAISPNDSILIIDDLLATGGTIDAVIQLVERSGGRVHEIAFLVELAFLNGRRRLKDHPVFSLIQYQ